METLLDCYFSTAEAQTIGRGCLSVQIGIHAQRLYDTGYRAQTARIQLRMLDHFQQWLEDQKIEVERVNASVVERYLTSRYRRLKRRRGDAAVMRHLLRLLPVDCPSHEPSQQEAV